MEIAEEHSRRRHKRSNGEHNNDFSVDRLSDLPDSVICHILSFLPTKFSVRTSILGQRWRFLWTYAPNLLFHNENPGTVDRVLSLHKLQDINTFRLTEWNDCNLYEIGAWISVAVQRNVRNVHIDLNFHVDLPRCLFTCKTLVDLNIQFYGAVPDVGIAVCLPRLKKLRLIHVDYEGDESLPHLISGCPVLEELLIHLFAGYYPFKIASLTVIRLTINFHSDGEASDNHEYDRLEIDTPALVYLRLIDCANQHIKSWALDSLTEADIHICNDFKPRDDFRYYRSVVDFIDRLHNVKCLKLKLSCCTEIIDSVFTNWESNSFHNLTNLELITDCCFLSEFLENADNLEILILSKVRNETKGWTEPQQVPTCLLSHLRTIKIVDFVGKDYVFEIIRYLLRNAQVLERMEIAYGSSLSSDEKIYMLEEISRFRRGSKECEVVFISK
ncbi:hypothetical protein ABFS83_13G077000 [Erythranthe nasuta]